MVSLIAAVAENGIIGNANAMPWHLSEDFRYFKAVTTGHGVIMGRKTWESLGRPLPARRNVVVSTTLNGAEGAEVARSLHEALRMFASDEEVFVIGGGSLYREAVGVADRLYITHIFHPFEGDTRFPDIDTATWVKVAGERHERGKDFEWPFEFAVYQRRQATNSER